MERIITLRSHLIVCNALQALFAERQAAVQLAAVQQVAERQVAEMIELLLVALLLGSINTSTRKITRYVAFIIPLWCMFVCTGA